MFVENTHVVFSCLLWVFVMSCVYYVTSFHSSFLLLLLLFHLFIYFINLFTIIIVIF